MSDDVLIISSSPEPEDLGTMYRSKGKGRATNYSLVDLTLENDVTACVILEDGPSDYGTALNIPADGGSHSDEKLSLAIQELQASGSGAQQEEPVWPEDPVERAILQVLSVIPNVDPEHLRALVLSYESQSEEVDISTNIISQLLENPDYPKIEPLKRKGGEDDDEDGPNKRPKVDYLAKERVAPTDISYMNYAIDHLMRVDFPQIPKDYVKKVFFKHGTLYAPAYFTLRSDLEAGNKFTVKKTLNRSESSRGKRKALQENKEFERERKWLLQFLEDEQVKKAEEAELAECERNGTGVECGCCFGDFPFSWMVQCPEAHLFCRECARRSAEECIGNRKTDLVCMDQSGCKLAFAISEIQRFLPAKSLELWHRIKQEQEIELAQIPGLESCPFCSYAVVIENEQERLFRCENARCGIVSCRECKKEDHLPKTCKGGLLYHVLGSLPIGFYTLAEVEEDKVLDARHAVEEAMIVLGNPRIGLDRLRKAGQSSSSKCPLWDSVDQRHADEVKRAAEAAQEEYRRLHPEIGEEDIAVDLPAAPAPPAPAPLLHGFVMPGGFPGAQQLMPAFNFGAPQPFRQQHQVLLQQRQQQLAQQAGMLAQHGRYFGGMLDPQRVFEELQANRAAERQRVREAALRREQEQLQAVVRVRGRVVVNPPPPPPPAPVPAPRRNPRRR
ncbi:hypothetical protein FRC06_004730 [Ceratobasidium sp. 370]|nr:hypothetical protein FRC06_004730 [Ceratobasidium sp. 370]